MKLLTHNLLSSHMCGMGPRGFLLCIQATKICVSPVDFNPDFVTCMIPKMEWAALVEAAKSLGHLSELPQQLADGYEKDEEFLRNVHHLLLEVEVVKGTLQCLGPHQPRDPQHAAE
ncbi:multifunctional methyltransferase subunit TRM112-like protein [Dromiciops gliroides]|uniref:multifunctional methyltransferase subunit TRM112-like protein n=1 Tax=Dromiciops gliroides TaxID=33562 RepID=UPI001CC4C32B|nr:multifunctional methyltransferase subunit TRM112-like protein [Dromiciops gliroides]